MLLSNVRRLLLTRTSVLRTRSATIGRQQSTHKGEAHDFRPSWVYTSSRLMTFTFIPGIVFYSMFFYDFGDKDHVFQPVRKWALEWKASFFALSPEEEQMLKINRNKSGSS